MNLSKKKGRTSVDQFLPGDRVVIQDNSSGKWLEEGVITLVLKGAQNEKKCRANVSM